ncbi:MAG: carboxypeptidase-like regulatory domain-containing protein, partial [Chitinophagaceae bacterium]
MKQIATQRHQLLKKIGILMLFSLTAFAGFAQVRISGKVTARSGAATESVSVLIKNTNTGTTVDQNGLYSFTANLKAGKYALVFSGVGFKSQEQSFTITDQKAVTINAEMIDESSKLDEVIVTGTSAGTTRKQLGSYVATLKAEDLNKGVAGNALQALQGKTPGAQITQNSG